MPRARTPRRSSARRSRSTPAAPSRDGAPRNSRSSSAATSSSDRPARGEPLGLVAEQLDVLARGRDHLDPADVAVAGHDDRPARAARARSSTSIQRWPSTSTSSGGNQGKIAKHRSSTRSPVKSTRCSGRKTIWSPSVCARPASRSCDAAPAEVELGGAVVDDLGLDELDPFELRSHRVAERLEELEVAGALRPQLLELRAVVEGHAPRRRTPALRSRARGGSA